jgi:hypothetical protein
LNLGRTTNKEQTAIAVFAAWLFFAPLAAMMFHSIPKRLSPELFPTSREFLIVIVLLGFSAGLVHALFFALTPRNIGHSICSALCIGFIAASITFIWFLMQHSAPIGWPLTNIQLYLGILLYSVALLFSYFVLEFIIRRQDVSS